MGWRFKARGQKSTSASTALLGIPAPDWGGTIGDPRTVEAPSRPSPWTSEVPGYYYIDPTTGNNTRTYGTPTAPRATIPTTLTSAYVEVHGTYSTVHGSSGTIVVSGTSGAFVAGSSGPCWIRGQDATTNRPTFTREFFIRGSYAIIENIHFNASVTPASVTDNVVRLSSASPSDHICYRHFEVTGDTDQTGAKVCLSIPAPVSGENQQIVVYDGILHDMGDVDAYRAAPSGDPDAGGIVVAANCHHIWILNCTVYHNMGTGIQINAGTGNNALLHHVYVGNCTGYNNLQGSFFTKQCSDVIFSGCTSHDNYDRGTGASSSPGKGFGFQYGPTRVWFINCVSYNNTYGFYGTSTSGLGDGGAVYIIGARIYGNRNEGVTFPTWTPTDSASSAAIMIREDDGNPRHIINCTIDGCNSGINVVNATSAAGLVTIQNTAITNRTEPTGFDMNFGGVNCHDACTISHGLIYQNPADFRVRVATTNYTSLAAYQARTGTQGDNFQTGDPAYTNVAANDYRIGTTSAGKNLGTTPSVYQTFFDLYGLSIAEDPAGTARPVGGTWDIGAYEATS